MQKNKTCFKVKKTLKHRQVNILKSICAKNENIICISVDKKVISCWLVHCLDGEIWYIFLEMNNLKIKEIILFSYQIEFYQNIK